MAKVTLTFEDREDGNVQLTTETDPPLERGASLTPAMRLVLVATQAVDRDIRKQKLIRRMERVTHQ